MLITLVFHVHQVADTLDGVLSSWLSTLSGVHRYEVIVTCDACTDGSPDVARATLDRFNPVLWRWQVTEVDDIFEIAGNNQALWQASHDSDLIIFIQGDNTMHTPHWDALLVDARTRAPFPGATALLAGGLFHPDGTYTRVESKTPHKGDTFAGLHPTTYPPGLYHVDFVTRPFAVDTSLLREMGGLGLPGMDVLCFDDTDLCAKLLQVGFTNQYLALDVVNTCQGQTTMKERMARSFQHNRALFLKEHGTWLAGRTGNTFRFIGYLVEAGDGVRLVHLMDLAEVEGK